MDESRDDRVERVRVENLVARTNVAAIELAVLLSAFDDVSRTSELVQSGGVPDDELTGIPDPEELFAKAEDKTTLEAFEILTRLLGMNAEGQARLWSVLTLNVDEVD